MIFSIICGVDKAAGGFSLREKSLLWEFMIERIGKRYFLRKIGNLQVVYNACIRIFFRDRDLPRSGDAYTADSLHKYRIRSVCYKPSF
jgi:hypothetical protein